MTLFGDAWQKAGVISIALTGRSAGAYMQVMSNTCGVPLGANRVSMVDATNGMAHVPNDMAPRWVN